MIINLTQIFNQKIYYNFKLTIFIQIVLKKCMIIIGEINSNFKKNSRWRYKRKKTKIVSSLLGDCTTVRGHKRLPLAQLRQC